MEAYTIKDHLEYLRQKSRNVKPNDPDLKENIERMKEFCVKNEVFAMASIQLGIPKRLIYLKVTNTNENNFIDQNYNENTILINPVIVERRGKTYFWEACVSGLDNLGKVLRPYQIKVRYLDEFGKKHLKTWKGFPATVISHEYDHLEGIFHMDIAEKILNMNKEDRKEFRKKPENQYQIVDQNGIYPYEQIYKNCK